MQRLVSEIVTEMETRKFLGTTRPDGPFDTVYIVDLKADPIDHGFLKQLEALRGIEDRSALVTIED